MNYERLGFVISQMIDNDVENWEQSLLNEGLTMVDIHKAFHAYPMNHEWMGRDCE